MEQGKIELERKKGENPSSTFYPGPPRKGEGKGKRRNRRAHSQGKERKGKKKQNHLVNSLDTGGGGPRNLKGHGEREEGGDLLLGEKLDLVLRERGKRAEEGKEGSQASRGTNNSF